MVAVTVTLELAETDALDTFDIVTHMGFGSGTTTPNAGDTTLQTELLRVSLESATKDSGNNKYTFIGRVPITQLNSSTINELGLFNASSSGTMACRILSPIAVTKTSDEEILFTIIVRVNAVNN